MVEEQSSDKTNHQKRKFLRLLVKFPAHVYHYSHGLQSNIPYAIIIRFYFKAL